tara:strand:- start:849 stop:1223 length:375 start_codon:yes stop_codon:yes gene_type:complete
MSLRPLLILIALSGCSLVDRNEPIPEVAQVEVVTIEKPAPVYHPALPAEIQFLPVEWAVLTPDEMEEYINDLRAGEAPTNVWYAMSTKSYENLSSNMADIKRYLRQILNIVDYYRKLEEEDDGG